MQFKNLATFAAIASMAVMGNAVAVERRGIADCVYELTATTPVPAGTDLQLDWNYRKARYSHRRCLGSNISSF
jgi:hypothetical protein